MSTDTYNFFALLSRMKYISRWALMRNSREEDLSEHAAEVAMIAHALCTIGNIRLHKCLNAEKAALIGLYHDASEIITGDMPTPVKYYNEQIRSAYREIEEQAEEKLLRTLPADLRAAYREIFFGSDDADEVYMRRLVKAADKLSALIKCVEEERAGNAEFRTAETSIRKAAETMREELPEVDIFMKEFFPPYGRTLDELSRIPGE